MSFNHCHHARSIQLVLGVLLSSSCTNEGRVMSTVGVRVSALEHTCATAPADVFGDVTSIPSSVEPLDPAQPQSYGSDSCAGFIFEFDNTDAEALRGAWIQASGESSASEDALGESQCPGRVLEADYWGYQAREWSLLASSSTTASFEPGELAGTGYCRLEAVIEHAGAFEKLRIVARVTKGSDSYPMYACVW